MRLKKVVTLFYTSTPHKNWRAEKEWIREMSWWDQVAPGVGLPGHGGVYHLHPVGLLGNFNAPEKCACGCCLGEVFSATRYGKQYGPVYWGETALADYKGWAQLIDNGDVSLEEKRILIAMSANEGNMDSLQSYDSEILTAGAMQKTINPRGAGELSKQVYEFKEKHPELYHSLFVKCGWEVRADDEQHYLYYDGLSGSELKALLRKGFDQSAFESKKKLASKPLAVFLNAINSEEYLIKQVVDFVARLRKAMRLTPTDFNLHTLGDYVNSSLGKALILDHHVNRPGNVARDFNASLKEFFLRHSNVPKNPREWGANHFRYESDLLSFYGPSRNMTDARLRYENLKGKFL
jgi:hypothetical protein